MCIYIYIYIYIYAGAYVVAKKLGKTKTNKTNEKKKDPFEFEKKDLDRIESKCKLSDAGNVQFIDMLKKKNISRCYKDEAI